MLYIDMSNIAVWGFLPLYLHWCGVKDTLAYWRLIFYFKFLDNNYNLYLPKLWINPENYSFIAYDYTV